MGFVALSFIVGFVGAVIWHRARKLPDWRMVVCRGHGGGAIEEREGGAVKEPQKPLPEPFTRAKMLVETEEKRHEHRLRAIAERFELMLSRLDEMQRANDE